MTDLELDELDYIDKIAELEYQRIHTPHKEELVDIDDKIKEYLEKYTKLVESR